MMYSGVYVITGRRCYLAPPLVNAAELVALHLQRKDDVVVKAEPDIRSATSRVEVANYFHIGVTHHFAMCSREFEREHLFSNVPQTAGKTHTNMSEKTEPLVF